MWDATTAKMWAWEPGGEEVLQGDMPTPPDQVGRRYCRVKCLHSRARWGGNTAGWDAFTPRPGGEEVLQGEWPSLPRPGGEEVLQGEMPTLLCQVGRRYCKVSDLHSEARWGGGTAAWDAYTPRPGGEEVLQCEMPTLPGQVGRRYCRVRCLHSQARWGGGTARWVTFTPRPCGEEVLQGERPSLPGQVGRRYCRVRDLHSQARWEGKFRFTQYSTTQNFKESMDWHLLGWVWRSGFFNQRGPISNLVYLDFLFKIIHIK